MDRATIEAQVSVSTTRIVNFIAPGGERYSTSLSGGALFAEAQREIEQRKARGEILDRQLSGLPGAAIEVTPLKITPSVSDPNNIVVNVSVRYSKNWLESYRSGVASVSTGSATSKEVVTDTGDARNSGVRVGRRIRMAQSCGESRGRRYGCCDFAAQSYANAQNSEEIPPRSRERVSSSAENPSGAGRPRSICIDYGDWAEYFSIPAGEYGNDLLINPEKAELTVALRFVDGKGETTHRDNSKCIYRSIAIGGGKLRLELDGALGGSHGIRDRVDATVSTSEVAGEFSVTTAEIDFSKTERVIIVPVFRGLRHSDGSVETDYPLNQNGYNEKWFPIFSVAPKALPQPDVCGEKLDELVKMTK